MNRHARCDRTATKLNADNWALPVKGEFLLPTVAKALAPWGRGLIVGVSLFIVGLHLTVRSALGD